MWLLFNADRGKPGFHVETRASLGGKLIMAVHCRAGVLPEQVFDQRSKRSPLRGRACVFGGLAVGSTTANIAHAYGVGVLPGAMRPGFRQAASGVDASVAVDHKVVAYAVEAAGAVPLVDLCHGVVLTLGGRSAVQDYLVYLSHCYGILRDLVADYRRAAFGLAQWQANAVLLEVHEVAVVLRVVLCFAPVEFCRAGGFHHTPGVERDRALHVRVCRYCTPCQFFAGCRVVIWGAVIFENVKPVQAPDLALGLVDVVMILEALFCLEQVVHMVGT